MKQFKKIFGALAMGVLAFCTALTFVACSNTPDSSSSGDSTSLDLTVSEADLAHIVGEGNLFLTSIGQGDFDTAGTLLDNVVGESAYTANNLLTAASVAEGDTVVIVLGASNKGLGAASGTDLTNEGVRADAFAAKENINIVVLHLGGAERRGETSDPLINKVMPAAKLVMYVKGGNDDGLFNTLCGNTIPLYAYSKMSAMKTSLQYVLGAQA